MLAAISTPVLLFLTSSSKPQLWPIAMTTFAFALVTQPSKQKLSKSNELISYMLICLLVMTASQAKFNYMLGGGVVGLLAIFFMIKQRYFLTAIGISFITAFLILMPPALWKTLMFHATFLEALTSLLPGHLPGTDDLVKTFQNSSDADSSFLFPLSIIIPSHLGLYGNVLGIGWLMLIGLRVEKNLRLQLGIVAAITILIANIFFAPQSARSYLEPYFWLLIILSMQKNNKHLSIFNWLKWPIYCQAFLTSAAICFGVAILFPGALLPKWRTHVMELYATGYQVMEWADTVLPKDAVLLVGIRSIAYSPRDAVAGASFTFLHRVNLKDPKSKIYLDRLKFRKVSHIMIQGPVDYDSQLAHCYGNLLPGPGETSNVNRNPFNKKSPKEKVWILEFNSQNLPECAYK